MPLLTVGLPVYNAMPYLPEAVESILHQDYTDFILVIVNDGSTDESRACLESLTDSRIRLYHQDNRGLGDTLNRILGLCNTKYLARMDADDTVAHDRLRKQIAFLETHPEVALLGTQIMFRVGDKLFCGARVPEDHEGIVRMLSKGAAGVSHASCVLRTETAKGISGYRLRREGEDIDFLLRMCEVAEVANLPEALYYIRLSPGSLTWTRRDEINRGYAYGLSCARCRRMHLSEPSLEEFCYKWEHRSTILRAGGFVKGWADNQYRKALLEEGTGHSARSWVRKSIAGLCNPKKGYSYLRRLLRYG